MYLFCTTHNDCSYDETSYHATWGKMERELIIIVDVLH